MSVIHRMNPSLAGLGCACQEGCTLNGLGYAISNPNNPGYPSSVNQYVRQGTTADALAQTSPDYPTPTALTVAQSFQSDSGQTAQPGHVSIPGINWVANNLSFVKPTPGPSATCPVTNWVNTNPWLLIGGVALLAYLTSGHVAKRRAARAKAA